MYLFYLLFVNLKKDVSNLIASKFITIFKFLMHFVNMFVIKVILTQALCKKINANYSFLVKKMQ